MNALLEMAKEMQEEKFLSRQSDIIPTERIGNISVGVIGVGGIGSNVVWGLASMGVRYIEMFDPDEVAEENIYPGNFSRMDVGQPKVDAMVEKLVLDLGLERGNIIDNPYEFDSHHSLYDHRDIFIVSTDTMESRRRSWQIVNDLELCNLWIDARMGGTSTTVLSVNMRDEELKSRYNKRVEGDSIDLPCGQKATASLTKGIIPHMVLQSVYDYVHGRDPVYGQTYDLQNRRVITYSS